MSISATEVSKIYSGQKALDKVSFSVKPGEIVGFLGPNGAGKSTMMKIISCYIPQNSGSVKICGLDVLESELEIKQKIGYLPENNPLYPEMYVTEYLEFIGGLYKIKDVQNRVEEVIEMVGLQKERHKKIAALSKGYRQRIGLAQSFIHNPEVLILDEPTTGLDPNQIVEIRNVIKQIGQNKTVLLSTHIMQEVEAICDRAVIINQGCIVADQSVESLKQTSGNEKSLKVSFVSEIDREALQKVLNVKSLKEMNSGQFEIYSKDLLTTKNTIMKFALENGYEIKNITEGTDSLEKVFRTLTQNKSNT